MGAMDTEMVTFERPPQPGGSQPAIRMVGVTKSYPAPGGMAPALRGINLEIAAGSFVGVFGKSGAGKTTLLNMITGVDRLTSGEVWVNGMAVHSLGENALAVWRGRNLGVVYQSFYLMPGLNLLANIALPIDLCGKFRGAAAAQRARELLRAVELEDHAGKLPSAISGGQQQRVAIARALANDPQIIVADEPTGRLDSATAETILQIFIRLVEQGKTILMVTHDLTLVDVVHRAVYLEDGAISTDVARGAQ